VVEYSNINFIVFGSVPVQSSFLVSISKIAVSKVDFIRVVDVCCCGEVTFFVRKEKESGRLETVITENIEISIKSS